VHSLSTPDPPVFLAGATGIGIRGISLRYTPSVTRIAYLWIIGGSACACVIAVVCGYFASIYGISPRRGKALFAAALFGGSGVFIAALTLLLYERHLPVFEAEGNIEAVQIYGGKQGRSDVLIHTSSGGDIAIHASGRSPYFRQGEHVKVRYQGETGAILKASFVSADGREEGVFNGTGMWPLFLFLLGGALVIVLGFKRYRRDPEGAEEPSQRNQHPYGSVDKESLLNLSEQGADESETDYELK
jgi:hypothetical protein